MLRMTLEYSHSEERSSAYCHSEERSDEESLFLTNPFSSVRYRLEEVPAILGFPGRELEITRTIYWI